jgi:hypothetical protein
MKTMTKEELLEQAKIIADEQAYTLLQSALKGNETQATFQLEVLKHTALNILGQMVFNHALDNESGLYSNSLALTRCNEISSEIYEIVKLAKKMHLTGDLERNKVGDEQ